MRCSHDPCGIVTDAADSPIESALQNLLNVHFLRPPFALLAEIIL